MRIIGRLALALTTVVALLLTVAAPAAATSQEGLSDPNGDFKLTVSVSSATDKDRDGNSDTATKPDKLTTLITTTQNFREDQIVELTITVDAPGTEHDRQGDRTIDLVNFSSVNSFFQDKVKNKWETGTFTVTVHAANGTDQVTLSGSVEVS